MTGLRFDLTSYHIEFNVCQALGVARWIITSFTVLINHCWYYCNFRLFKNISFTFLILLCPPISFMLRYYSAIYEKIIHLCYCKDINVCIHALTESAFYWIYCSTSLPPTLFILSFFNQRPHCLPLSLKNVISSYLKSLIISVIKWCREEQRTLKGLDLLSRCCESGEVYGILV